MMFRRISGGALLLATFGALLAILAAGCGGKQTVASRSAAAYQEAREKGLPVEGGGHAGHGSASEGGQTEMDHSKLENAGAAEMDHSKMQHGGMAGMDHSKMRYGGMAGMDHSKTQHGDMAGKDQSKMEHGGGMAGMGHSKMEHGGGMAGMDHSKTEVGMSMGDAETAAVVADKSAAPTPGKPAAVLSRDAVDAPAATSVEDAQRSARMNEAMSSGEGMMMMSHGMYVQRDAGRGEAAPQQPMHHTSQPPSGPMKDTGQDANAAYSCPMHPEVTSAAAGKCPKCGMTLVKRAKR